MVDMKKLKIGSSVNYETRGSNGRGKVTEIWQGLRGVWITVYDKANDREINLRPAQLSR